MAQENLRLLVESIRDYAIFMLDVGGRVVTWNAGARAIKGYDAEEIIGQHISIFYPPEDRESGAPDATLARALAEGRVEHEGWRVRKDGSRFWANIVITRLRNAAGEHVGFAKVTRDLTAWRAAEEKAREAEERLSATLYSIGDGVLVTDQDARITMINRVAEGLTGWAEREATGRPIDEIFNIVNEETRRRAFNPVARVLKEGIIVGLANHTALIARDGTERPIADSGAPIRDTQGGVRGAVLVFRDVTEERRAEDALRQSEERFRSMIASVRDYAILMLDPKGHVVSWNPGAQRIKGYTDTEIIGSHFSRFFTAEDVAGGRPERELEIAAREGRFEDETWRVRKDGTPFWANVVITAVTGASGELVGYTKVTRDLTERKKAEEERVRLAQAQEALRLRDEFLSIASHELKTPMTALDLQLQGIWDRVVPTADASLALRLQRAKRASARLADLIDSLLDVSRIATGKLTLAAESFDLVEAARDVVERVRETANAAGCSLTFEAPGSILGRWDRLRIEQIFTNLLANAFKYAGGTPVVLTVDREDVSARIEVRDGGPGLAAGDLERIFKRFERASSGQPSGMGLGLYIAAQIAEAHGGSISASNLEPKGASFTVRLPLQPESG